MSKSKSFVVGRWLPVTVLLLQACGSDGGGGGGGGGGAGGADAALSGGAGGQGVGGADAAVNGGSGGDPVGEPDAAASLEPDAATTPEPDAAVAPPVLNASCDDAAANGVNLALDAAEATQGTLSPVASAQQYFMLALGEGNPAPDTSVLLVTDAKPAEDEFSTAYPDLVVTLYARQGGQWVQAAQNDDPEPRFSNDSELFTRLPPSEDGRYCVRIAECTSVFGEAGCAPAADITHDGFAVRAVPMAPEFVETEPNDDAATAGAVLYEPGPSGGYYSVVETGASGGSADVDVWSFSVPADAFAGVAASDGTVAGACRFSLFRPGPDGNGSTAAAGVIASVADSADPLTLLARTDVFADPATPAEISFRCRAGGSYLLSVGRAPDAAAGAHDFYFWRHGLTQTNPLESEAREGGPQDANNVAATADALAQVQNADGSVSYFVEGAIDHDGDVDHFSVEVPPGLTSASAACEGQRLGSAVRGLTVRAFGAPDAAAPLDGGTASETAEAGLGFDGVDITGSTSVVFAVSASSLDPGVRLAGYRCGFHLSASQP